jgi:hypothetical protein
MKMNKMTAPCKCGSPLNHVHGCPAYIDYHSKLKPISAEELARELYDTLETTWGDGDMTTWELQQKMTKKDIERIAAQLVAYGEERDKAGYERARIDLNAIHSAKWAEEDEQKGYRRAAEICDAEANAKRQCAAANEGHDDRWCPTCDAMEDMALVLAERIRALDKSAQE